MKKLFMILPVIACIFSILPAGESHKYYSETAPSDTMGTQKDTLKNQDPRHKFKKHTPAQETGVSIKPDSLGLRRAIDAPLLRLKDSSQNFIH